MSGQESAQAFADIISFGIDAGFVEVRRILFALNVVEAKVAGNIDQAYNLLQEALTAFVDSYSPNVEES